MLMLILAVILFVLFFFNEKAKYWKKRGVKGPNALPIVGNLLDYLWKPYSEVEKDRFRKFGRIYGTMQGPIPVITIGEPKLLKKMLTTDFRVFMDHRVSFLGDPIMEKMLIEVNGDEWRRMRAILSPTFTTGKLKAMQPLIEDCVDNTLKFFDKASIKREEFDAKLISMSFTLDTIASTVFGVDTNWFENPKHEFIKSAHELFDFSVIRCFSRMVCPAIIQRAFEIHILPRRQINYFINILRTIMDQRRNYEYDNVINDFITLLLNAELKKDENRKNDVDANENVKKLTDNEIRSNLFLFFAAGYDTTSTFLNFALYVLASYPKKQEMLYQEINDYFQAHDEIDYNSLKSLPFFDAFINETLRLYTPVTCFEHICGENYKLDETEVTIEKGTIVNLPFYAMHHDPELFPNPSEFIPERFLPENEHNIEPYSFMPFGAGPRMCIGNRLAAMISKMFLAKLVNSFKVVKTRNTPLIPEFNGLYLFLQCKPIMVSVEHR